MPVLSRLLVALVKTTSSNLCLSGPTLTLLLSILKPLSLSLSLYLKTLRPIPQQILSIQQSVVNYIQIVGHASLSYLRLYLGLPG